MEKKHRIATQFTIVLEPGEFQQFPEGATLIVESGCWVFLDNSIKIDTLLALHKEQGEYLVLAKKSRLRTTIRRFAERTLQQATQR